MQTSTIPGSLQALSDLVKSCGEQPPDGTSSQSTSVSAGSTQTKLAGSADRLALWYWSGDDLIPDG